MKLLTSHFHPPGRGKSLSLVSLTNHEAPQCIIQGCELIPLALFLEWQTTSPRCPVSYSSALHPSHLACQHIPQRNRQARLMGRPGGAGWLCLCSTADRSTQPLL